MMATQVLAAAAELIEPEEDIPGSKPLTNAKWEAFAVEYSKGRKSVLQCYMFVYGVSEASASSNSYLIMGNKGVMERIAFLQSYGRDLAVVSFGEMCSYLAAAIRTPPEDIGIDSPLCQSYKRKRLITGQGDDAQEWEVEELRIVDKLHAVDTLADLLKYLPDKKLTVDLNAKVAVVTVETTLNELASKCQESPRFAEAMTRTLGQAAIASGKDCIEITAPNGETWELRRKG